MPLARLPSQAEEVACSSRERTPALQPQFSRGFFVVYSRGTLVRGDSCHASIPSSRHVQRPFCLPFSHSARSMCPHRPLLLDRLRNLPRAKLWMRWGGPCAFPFLPRASFRLPRASRKRFTPSACRIASRAIPTFAIIPSRPGRNPKSAESSILILRRLPRSIRTWSWSQRASTALLPFVPWIPSAYPATPPPIPIRSLRLSPLPKSWPMFLVLQKRASRSPRNSRAGSPISRRSLPPFRRGVSSSLFGLNRSFPLASIPLSPTYSAKQAQPPSSNRRKIGRR